MVCPQAIVAVLRVVLRVMVITMTFFPSAERL
jgi:hypothetical protein